MTCVRSAGKLLLDDEPDCCMVDAEIVVDHGVPKTNHAFSTEYPGALT